MNFKELNEQLQKYIINEELSRGRIINTDGTPRPHLTIRSYLAPGMSRFIGYAFNPADIDEVNNKTIIKDEYNWSYYGKTFEQLPKGFGHLVIDGVKDFSQLQSLKNLDVKERIEISGYGTSGNTDFDLSWLPSNFSGILDLSAMNIKSLKGCPQNITELYLSGVGSKKITGLESLEGCPQNLRVLSVRSCVDLKSLKGIARNIGMLILAGNTSLTTWEGAEIDSIEDYDFHANGKLTIRTAPEAVKQLANNKKQAKLNKQQASVLPPDELKNKENTIKKEFPQAVKYKRANGLKLQVSFPQGGDSDSIVKRAQELANTIGAKLEVTAHPNYGYLILNFFI